MAFVSIWKWHRFLHEKYSSISQTRNIDELIDTCDVGESLFVDASYRSQKKIVIHCMLLVYLTSIDRPLWSVRTIMAVEGDDARDTLFAEYILRFLTECALPPVADVSATVVTIGTDCREKIMKTCVAPLR